MKIACISPSVVPSSTANSMQVMKVCHALAQLGHEVRLWVPGISDAKWDTLAGYYGLSTPFDVTWLGTLPILRKYDLSWLALNQARGWNASAIYTWLPQAAWLGQRFGLPAVLEQHDRPTGILGPLFLRWFAQGKGKKHLLVITRALQLVLEKECSVRASPGETLVAPNGVELERYSNLPYPSEARSRLGLSESLTAVYTGHFYPGRGMDLLFALARSFPQIKFLWVGGKPADVSHWKKDLELASMGNVTLAGFVENQKLPLFQAAGDVLLMPYERSIEGSSGGNSADICSPMKMFEYLAAGRAIITSDLPVIREVLNDNNAVFCPPEDPTQWGIALKRLISDEALRERLGKKARQDSERYSWRERASRALEGLT